MVRSGELPRDIGSGLVGQAFLEGDTIQLKQIPTGYTTITSGLGDATPRHLVIVPLKYDITTVAILELASFGDFEAHRTLPASQNPTNAFEFVIKKPAVGDFPTPIGVALLTRLRVDGVDSEILAPLGQNQPENTPLEFDATKKITIT